MNNFLLYTMKSKKEKSRCKSRYKSRPTAVGVNTPVATERLFAVLSWFLIPQSREFPM